MVNFYTDLKDIHEKSIINYCPAFGKTVTLNGDFTSDELRRIADTIDAILEEIENKNE